MIPKVAPLLALLLFAGHPLLAKEPAKAALVVTEPVDILKLIKDGETYVHLNKGYDSDADDKAEDIFVLNDEGLLVTGKGWGYLATKSAYRDYHLTIEFKWTGRTWGRRADRARDTGILVHCHGPAGAHGGTWSASIEAQIIEGGMGDILVLSPKTADGTVYESSVEAEFELDRDGEKRWKKGAPRQKVTSGRINWEKRHEDWADKVDIRFPDDLDKPVGEWNTLEVVAKGDTLQYFFNGVLVNEAFAAQPSEGPVGLQTEAAEFVVRRFDLQPLKK